MSKKWVKWCSDLIVAHALQWPIASLYIFLRIYLVSAHENANDGANVAQPVSLGRIWAADNGHLNVSKVDKQRRKKTDRTAVHEPYNRTRELYSPHYAALACAEDVLKTFELGLH